MHCSITSSSVGIGFDFVDNFYTSVRPIVLSLLGNSLFTPFYRTQISAQSNVWLRVIMSSNSFICELLQSDCVKIKLFPCLWTMSMSAHCLCACSSWPYCCSNLLGVVRSAVCLISCQAFCIRCHSRCLVFYIASLKSLGSRCLT